MSKYRVLVVDDEETIRNLLKSRLEREGYDVTVAPNADDAQNAFNKGEFAVMITDLKMPGRDGHALTSWVKDKHAHTQVIVITGHGEKEAAVKSLRGGAMDYMEKPFDMEELSKSVKRAAQEHQTAKDSNEQVARLEARVERIEGKTEDKYWYVSKAESMNKVNEWLTILRREAMRGGAEEPSVIVLGESGTGKEGIARMIHAGSRRGKGPWVAVNCANFNEQLLESELFGHEKGSFTGANSLKRGLFEIAKGGTLFLDEIGEMDVKLQAKLLRVLQEKAFRRVGGNADLETDVRIVAATNRNLQDKIKEGKFREDLYHRLSRVVMELPALRERKEDVVPMATQFADRAFRSRGKHFNGFSADAQEALRTYAWPGNVRELLNVIERSALLWDGQGNVNSKSLGLGGSAHTGTGAGESFTPGTTTAFGGKLELVASPFRTPDDNGTGGYTDLKKKWADSFEREYLTATLTRHAGNVSAAAREARLDRSNFLRLLRRHGLKAQVYRKVAA